MRYKTLEHLQADEYKRERKHRPVKIDSKTTILVSEGISDQDARTNYLTKIGENHKKFDSKNTVQRWK